MSLANFGSQMLAEIRRIAEQIVRRDGTHLRWATVTSSDPLRIRYDGETSESIVPPQNLVAGLEVGDRVRVAKQDGQATIIGPQGGPRPPHTIIAGSVPITNAAAGIGSVTVTFPAGAFETLPVVQTTPNTTNPSTRQTTARVIATDSATLHLWSSGAATVDVMWTATL